MEQSSNRLALERLADETAAQAFGVGFNDLHSFITQKCESRQGEDMIKTLDTLLHRLFHHRNRLLRVHLLPDEILVHIFKLALDFDWTTDITRNNSIHSELKTYYEGLYLIQRVSKRWHDVIASYAPFWSLISNKMPHDMLELALTRAHESSLSVGLQNAGEAELGEFTDRLLPLSDRVGSLTMDHRFGGSDAIAPLWTSLPNIRNLRVADMDDFPYKELYDSSQTINIPSPRWIYLHNSTLPTVPTLYSQVEELVLEHPSEALTISDLKLIAGSTPRLRIFRLDEIRHVEAEGLNDPSSLAPIPMPNLQLLHISRTYRDFVAWLLDRFQLLPRTSLRIQCWDWNISPFQNQIRDRIWSVLLSTEEASFSLDLAPWAYRFQTRNVSIAIEISNRDKFTRWPDFFDGFVPQAGQAPIRVYIFLKSKSVVSGHPGDLPNEDCIKGLQNDSFFVMG
ncbi:hypothetical protein FS837_003074 [Tulasnella sp. UAMH 9824]|nr:hypothetical protein FS837_003074 [Tulasnella sp. UAMH 9824]